MLILHDMKILIPLAIAMIFLAACQEKREDRKRSRPNKTREAFSIMRNDDCFTCHGIEDDGAGPSYRRIAERYESDNTTIQRLSKKVLEGGGGVWGSGQMIRHDFIKPFEAEKVVRWVLSLDADSVMQKTNNIAPSIVLPDSSETIRIFTRDQEQPVNEGKDKFMGSIDYLHFPDLSSIKDLPGENFLVFNTVLDITLRGKYFFKLVKNKNTKMYMNGNQVISERDNDHEIMLELEPGSYKISIICKPEKNSPLSLFWLPRGERYYTLFRSGMEDG